MGRAIIVALSLTLAVLHIHVAEAQHPSDVPRIGFLAPMSASAVAGRLDALRQGLRELGYVEGKNITIDYRYADGKAERLPGLATELVRLRVNLIITSSTPSVLAIKKPSAGMPIVFTIISHPVENGIVSSFARPSGNATGLTILTEELSGKRLELLKEAVPNVSLIGVFSDLTNPTQALEWKEILAAAQVLRLRLHSLGVRSSNDFDGAFKAALRERAQALMTLPQPLMTTHRNLIVEFAAKNRLPAIYPGAGVCSRGRPDVLLTALH